MAKKSKRHPSTADVQLNIRIAKFGDCLLCGRRHELDEHGKMILHEDPKKPGAPCAGSCQVPESKEERDRRITGAARDRLSNFFGWR